MARGDSAHCTQRTPRWTNLVGIVQTAAPQALTKSNKGEHLFAAAQTSMPRNRDDFSSTDLVEIPAGGLVPQAGLSSGRVDACCRLKNSTCVFPLKLNTLRGTRITGFAQLSRIFNFYLAGLLHRP